jgi:prolyl-tRNA synthetase
VLNQDGVETPVIMGSYGIGVERILCAAVELYSDKDGMCLPVSIAPFEVVVTPVKASDASLKEGAEKIYAELKAAGVDALYDDRELSPGVKFKDADLVGIPYRITVGRKMASGLVEIVERRTKTMTEVPVANAVAWLTDRIRGAKFHPEVKIMTAGQ